MSKSKKSTKAQSMQPNKPDKVAKPKAEKKAKAPKVPSGDRPAPIPVPADSPCKLTGQRLKKAIEGREHAEVAKAMGISVGYLRCLTTGRPVHLSASLLERLEKATGLHLGENQVNAHNEQARDWYRQYRARVADRNNGSAPSKTDMKADDLKTVPADVMARTRTRRKAS